MKTITIHVDTERDAYLVLVGDRIADRLTFEEALGLVAAELIPGAPRAREWLKTPEEWRERERARAERFKAEVMQGVDPKDYAANGERLDELRTVEVPVVDSTKLGLLEQHKAALDDAISSTFGISTLELSKRDEASAQAWPDGVVVNETISAMYGTTVWHLLNGTQHHLLVAKRPNSADPGFDWLAPGEHRAYAGDEPSFVATHPFKPEDRL